MIRIIESVTVTANNDLLGSPNGFITTDATASLTVSATNDADGDALNYTIVSGPAHGGPGGFLEEEVGAHEVHTGDEGPEPGDGQAVLVGGLAGATDCLLQITGVQLVRSLVVELHMYNLLSEKVNDSYLLHSDLVLNVHYIRYRIGVETYLLDANLPFSY